jgi:hypothetical protein
MSILYVIPKKKQKLLSISSIMNVLKDKYTHTHINIIYIKKRKKIELDRQEKKRN